MKNYIIENQANITNESLQRAYEDLQHDLKNLENSECSDFINKIIIKNEIICDEEVIAILIDYNKEEAWKAFNGWHNYLSSIDYVFECARGVRPNPQYLERYYSVK